MHLWRVVLPHRAGDALSGEGARRFGGRWNRPGQAAVYCATTPSLAVLEWLVNVDPPDAPAHLVAIHYELADDEPVSRYHIGDLPVDWRTYPVPEHTRALGVEWLAAGETCALIVPSAVLPLAEESNVVLNPQHPGLARLCFLREETISLDSRVFQ